MLLKVFIFVCGFYVSFICVVVAILCVVRRAQIGRYKYSLEDQKVLKR